MESQIPVCRKKWDNLLEKHYKLYWVDITQLQLHYWIIPVKPRAGEFISIASIRANGKHGSKALWIHCIFCKKCFTCWELHSRLDKMSCKDFISHRIWENHTSPVYSHGLWHQGRAMLREPVQMCHSQPPRGWPSPQWGRRWRAIPLPALLPALEFSLPSRCAHCPQPPPLIDLGPVPVSNCFLQIGFAPDCWLLSSNFSTPYMPFLARPYWFLE